MADVFLSYSSEDAIPALRLDNDLRHARIQPWRYEADSRSGVEFDREFESELTRCRVVCLLDSAAARRSPYVARECRLARRLAAEAGRPRLLVCLLEARGRPEEAGWWSTEPFPGLNRLTYIDFADWEDGVRRLCEELDVPYRPGFSLPRDREVEAEIFAAGLNRAATQELIDAYAGFRCRYAVDPVTARAYLQVVIGRCAELGARDVTSPRLALGVMWAEAGEHQRALDVFWRLTELWPTDPRGWMGLAGARYYLGDVAGALETYLRCRELTAEPADETDRLRADELTHNIARCLGALGRSAEARELLAALPAERRRQPFVRALAGALALAEGDAVRARDELEAARRGFDGGLPLSLVLDLADTYQRLGLVDHERGEIERALGIEELSREPELQRRAADLYHRVGEPRLALAALRLAAERAADGLVYRAELASMLWQLGDREAARREAERAIADGMTPRQRYYRGLALHLLGSRQRAAEEERRSRREDPAIRGWPGYDELLGPGV